MTKKNSRRSTHNSQFKMTEVGEIPVGWEVSILDRFWNVIDCKHVTAKFIAHGFPVASIKEVQSRFIDLSEAKQTTEKFFNLLTEGGRKLRPGDLILSRNATVGEVAQVAEWHPLFAMGQDVCLLRKKSPAFSTSFLQSYLQSPLITNQLSDLMVGSTFKRVNVQQIKSLAVTMPPLAEQELIAGALSDVDELIESLAGLLDKKRHLKQAAMQLLLTGKKRLPGFHGEWDGFSLEDLGRWTGGMTPSMRNRDYWEGGDFPWISSGDVKLSRLFDTQQHITTTAINENATTVLPTSSIVIVVRSGILRRYLPVAMLMRDMAVNQDIKGLIPNSIVYPEFILHALTFYGNDIMARCLKSGTTVESIELIWLKRFQIKLPGKSEQT